MQIPHKPTPALRRLVETLAARGVTQLEIGRVVGVSDNTLRKYYPDELAFGRTLANAAVAANLFKIAISDAPGSLPAAIFWLKCRAGWHA